MTTRLTLTETRPSRLVCCVCGESTTGRQWWNRDAGYGICPRCWVSESTNPDAQRLYGTPGVHHSLTEE